MNKVEGRVAIVTGAAQGIGAAYAKALAAEGARVAVADVIETANTVNIINQAGGVAIGLATDITDEAQVAAMVAKTLDSFGQVDVLVNNAALFGELKRQPFMEIELDEWDRVMRVNIRGSFQCAKAVVPAMRQRKYGKIINISSGTVFKGTPALLHYVTSKGAIIAFTRALAREVGYDGICVNAIAPGLTMSEAVAGADQWAGSPRELNVASRAIKREEEPEDVTGTLIYLASADSDFVTGQTLVVDGGSAMH